MESRQPRWRSTDGVLVRDTQTRLRRGAAAHSLVVCPALFIEWLTDALSTELSRHSSIVDGVDDEESETCISMHGTNAAQMVLVARRVLSECERPVAVQIVETQQSHGAEFAA